MKGLRAHAGTTEKYLSVIESIVTAKTVNPTRLCKENNVTNMFGYMLVKMNLLKRVGENRYCWNGAKKPTLALANKVRENIVLHQRNLKKASVKPVASFPKAPQVSITQRVATSGRKVSEKLSMTEQEAISFLKGCTHCTYEIYRVDRNKL